MTVDRRPSLASRVVRPIFFLLFAALGALLLGKAVTDLASRDSPIVRWRAAPRPPHVHLAGTLRASPGSDFPPICLVQHERWGSCGKSRCWVTRAGITTAQGVLVVSGSSSPVAAEVHLDAGYRFEPRLPPAIPATGARAAAWKERATRAKVDFSEATLPDNRIVERCLAPGDEIQVEGCYQDGRAPAIGACGTAGGYIIVRGPSAQPAIDDAADGIAGWAGAAFAAFLVSVVFLIRTPPPVVDALADRSGRPKESMVRWALLVFVPVVAVCVNFFLRSNTSLSTWATGRGGYILAFSAFIAWVLLAKSLLQRRRWIAAALTPVLATERSLLANASGTAELAVRAVLRDGGVAPILDEAPVAFAEAVISETYRSGKNITSRVLMTVRPTDSLAVADESGDGLLHLVPAVLDVETRTASFTDVPPRVAARGIALDRDSAHVQYVVTERLIREREPLYVLGEVSAVALQAAGDQGYRAVRGSPTLGGSGAPVLVYAGDEVGLVASLRREARAAQVIATAGACACGLLSAIVCFLAWL